MMKNKNYFAVQMLLPPFRVSLNSFDINIVFSSYNKITPVFISTIELALDLNIIGIPDFELQCIIFFSKQNQTISMRLLMTSHDHDTDF